MFFGGLFLSVGEGIEALGDFCEWLVIFFHNLIIGLIE